MALLAFVASGTASSGCSKTDLVVKVGAIPDAAIELRVLVAVDDVLSDDVPRYTLPPVGEAGRLSFSFGARVLDRSSGSASISVAAVSDPECIIATGSSLVPDLSQPPGETLVVLAPTKNSETACAGTAANAKDRPQLFAAEQHLTSAGVGERYLELDGWGFAPGIAVTIDGAAAQELRYESPIKLRTALPTISDPSGVQSFLFRATNPNGDSAQLTALLTLPLFNTTDTLIYQPALTNTTPIYEGLAVADVNGESGLPRSQASASPRC